MLSVSSGEPTSVSSNSTTCIELPWQEEADFAEAIAELTLEMADQKLAADKAASLQAKAHATAIHDLEDMLKPLKSHCSSAGGAPRANVSK